jgi:hypothetical protein
MWICRLYLTGKFDFCFLYFLLSELYVLDRMIRTNEWSPIDLIKYLVAVRNTLTTEEWDRLRATSAFPKEPSPSDKENDATAKKRYQARQLYEPTAVHRQLGLPVLDWGTENRWRGTSEEARFLFDLGLLRQPPLKDIIPLCASGDQEVGVLCTRRLFMADVHFIGRSAQRH